MIPNEVATTGRRSAATSLNTATDDRKQKLSGWSCFQSCHRSSAASSSRSRDGANGDRVVVTRCPAAEVWVNSWYVLIHTQWSLALTVPDLRFSLFPGNAVSPIRPNNRLFRRQLVNSGKSKLLTAPKSFAQECAQRLSKLVRPRHTAMSRGQIIRDFLCLSGSK